LQLHHLVCDHASLRTIVSEALVCLQGRELTLPPAGSYGTHVAHSLAQIDSARAEEFFRHKLSGIDEPTAPFALLDVHGDSSHVEEARRIIDPSLASAVRSAARRHGASAARLFHAAWALV